MTTILNMDSVEALRTLDNGSVQMVCTSPPYDGLRSYGNHSWNFERMANELFRVVCDGGIVCWNVNDAVVDGSETLTSFRQAIYFKDVAGFRVHDTMIWKKLNFANPESVRYHQIFEYVFILSKGVPRCFNPLKDRPNAMAGKIGSYGANTFTKRDGTKGVRERYVNTEFGMRHNLWTGKTRGQEELHNGCEHPAMMPKWLARDLILSFSNPGDLVADPMAGSGTTGREAVSTGRRAWLNEIHTDYIPLCHEAVNVTAGLAI